MIKIYLFFIILGTLFTQAGQAQYAYFATRGTIQYDKVTYTKARMRDMMNEVNRRGDNRGGMMWGNQDNMPESSTQKYILYFDENTSLMQSSDSTAVRDSKKQTTRGGNIPRQSGQRPNRGGNSEVRFGNGRNGVAIRSSGRDSRGDQQKIIFQDLKNNTAEIQFEADEKYLLTDTLEEVTWRFTDEYRTIAGFNCRRVNGATKDSLYLIAYYTDEIPLSAGPALSHGLPGMILGLVIPEMHVQYWATHIDYSNNQTPSDWKDKKAKKISADEFAKAFGRFMPRMRDNGTNKSRLMENILYQ